MLLEEFIRNRIDELRTARGVAEKKLSEDIGFSKSYIRQISTGYNLPSFEGLKQICDYFHISLSEFFEGESSEKNSITKQIERLTFSSTNREFFIQTLSELTPEGFEHMLEFWKALKSSEKQAEEQ